MFHVSFFYNRVIFTIFSPSILQLLSSKPATPKTPKSRSARATPKSAKAQEAAKAREDARRKLIEAKKAGRRQRKTSENAEDIEINIVT